MSGALGSLGVFMSRLPFMTARYLSNLYAEK